MTIYIYYSLKKAVITSPKQHSVNIEVWFVVMNSDIKCCHYVPPASHSCIVSTIAENQHCYRMGLFFIVMFFSQILLEIIL